MAHRILCDRISLLPKVNAGGVQSDGFDIVVIHKPLCCLRDNPGNVILPLPLFQISVFPYTSDDHSKRYQIQCESERSPLSGILLLTRSQFFQLHPTR